jgi:ribosomal protein S3AE
MGNKRGTSAFKKRDVERAIRSARDAGVAPAVVEVETKDGVIIRVFSGAATTDTTQDTAGTKAWNAEIAKLKATPKGGKGQ